MQFRKIRFVVNHFESCGFLSPEDDPTKADRNLWLPIQEQVKANLNKKGADMILKYASIEFCKLVNEEGLVAKKYVEETGRPVIWKRMQEKVIKYINKNIVKCMKLVSF